jgi:hypothetical protein
MAILLCPVGIGIPSLIQKWHTVCCIINCGHTSARTYLHIFAKHQKYSNVTLVTLVGVMSTILCCIHLRSMFYRPCNGVPQASSKVWFNTHICDPHDSFQPHCTSNGSRSQMANPAILLPPALKYRSSISEIHVVF